jgi:hypothetical protein
MESLYSESVVAKIWNIASKALLSVRHPGEIIGKQKDSLLTQEAEQTTCPLPRIHRLRWYICLPDPRLLDIGLLSGMHVSSS